MPRSRPARSTNTSRPIRSNGIGEQGDRLGDVAEFLNDRLVFANGCPQWCVRFGLRAQFSFSSRMQIVEVLAHAVDRRLDRSGIRDSVGRARRISDRRLCVLAVLV